MFERCFNLYWHRLPCFHVARVASPLPHPPIVSLCLGPAGSVNGRRLWVVIKDRCTFIPSESSLSSPHSWKTEEQSFLLAQRSIISGWRPDLHQTGRSDHLQQTPIGHTSTNFPLERSCSCQALYQTDHLRLPADPINTSMKQTPHGSEALLDDRLC